VLGMSAEDDLNEFIEKFAPNMQTLIRACRAGMHARFPNAKQLVYDNYNFLVIGFGPTVRASDVIFSLAAQRTGINLCFLQHGADLPDPAGVLRGSGKVVRNLPLQTAKDLDSPDTEALISAALQRAKVPMDASDELEVIIKSVSAKQRPRQ
jgi:hypothetical protein